MLKLLSCAVLLQTSAFLYGQSPKLALSHTPTVTLVDTALPTSRIQKDDGPTEAAAVVSGVLMFRRPADRQRSLEQYVEQLTEPASPNYHCWLSLAEIGRRYGPQLSEVEGVKRWLQGEGFHVRPMSPDNMSVWFEGTVKQAQETFHASIHNVTVDGVQHFANLAPLQIPANFTPVISGVLAFSDLAPTRKRFRNEPYGVIPPAEGGGEYLAPADLATIYDYKPLFAAGITGKGVTIALLEDNDQDSLGDWQVFRKVFGLSRAYPEGTLINTNPQGSFVCKDPGKAPTAGVEEAIDVDAATASAPNATLVSAACAGTNYLQGAVFALANLLQAPVPPTIASLSFGGDEVDMVPMVRTFLHNLYLEAAGMHVSVFASSGDEGGSAFRGGVTGDGIRVNGYADSPYVTAVGATDTGVEALGESHSQYFSPTNFANFASALSYIPEIPWNASCTSSVKAKLVGAPVVGANGLCNKLAAAGTTIPAGATGGGPSGCASGSPATPGVVSGSCQGTPKPVWQSLIGVPADGVRDLPDVSIFGSNAVYGLAFRICDSVSKPCTGDPSTWNVGSGTSISSPLWAGIQALINQATGTSWGSANPQLYTLARNAYGSSGNAACNASSGNQISSDCVFHDVTLGDNVVPCTGSIDCYLPGGVYGALSFSSTKYEPAFVAGTGYDLATGIGTPDVTNLVHAWQAAFPNGPSTSVSAPQ